MKNTIAGASFIFASSVNMYAAALVYNAIGFRGQGDHAPLMIFGVVQFILGLYFFFIAKDKPPKE